MRGCEAPWGPTGAPIHVSSCVLHTVLYTVLFTVVYTVLLTTTTNLIIGHLFVLKKVINGVVKHAFSYDE